MARYDLRDELDGQVQATLAEGATLPFAPPVLEGGDLLFLQYTGGTTGVSKGATLTHGNLVANHTPQAKKTDQPIAGLLIDLKRRGLLDQTCVDSSATSAIQTASRSASKPSNAAASRSS